MSGVTLDSIITCGELLRHLGLGVVYPDGAESRSP
jgi:hypothetical protein